MAAWAARLGICDDALGKFTGLWFSLDAATRSSAPPPKDGTRCSACSRRIGIGRKKRGLNYEKHGGDCDTACSKAVVKVLAAIARDAGESYYGGVNSHKKVAAYKAEARPGEEVDESAPSLRRAADDRGRKYDGKSGTAGDASFVAPVASFEPAVDCTPKCVRVYAQSGERCGRACPGLLASLEYASDEFCSCRCETAELARRDEVLETAREIEAARAIGMSRFLLFRRITFPVAIRQALPAYGNEIILMVKSTSLASTITILEVTGEAKKIIAATWSPVEVFIIAGAIYLTLNFIVTRAVGWTERRLNPMHNRRETLAIAVDVH